MKIDATAEKVHRIYSKCPICGNDFTHHLYVRFSITIVTPDTRNRVIQFFASLKKHDWQSALQFQEFDSMYHAVEAFAIRCINEQIELLVLKNPTEYYESDQIIFDETLILEESKKLESLIENAKWKRLSA